MTDKPVKIVENDMGNGATNFDNYHDGLLIKLRKKMKRFIKDEPILFISLIILLLTIPFSIISYFVLGTNKSHDITLNYGVPTICTIMVLNLFTFETKHRDKK